jgi:2-pyrone-4,6-dicarboxylate lactonase
MANVLQIVQTFNPRPTRPRLVLPQGACDAHVHVFGPRAIFPFDPERQSTPQDAPKEVLFKLHKQMGIERCVIVQSMVHALDNRVVEDALKAGRGAYLGVALLSTHVSDQELQRLASLGFRGVRFNFMKHLGGAQGEAGVQRLKDIIALTHRLKDVGMHLQVHFESSLIHELSKSFEQSAVPVVIDHMARVDAKLGEKHADFVALTELLRNPHFHVKVSGIDRIDQSYPFDEPNQPYFRGIALARLLVQNFPDQCVWGSDWPHPNHTHIPDDGALVDALSQIAPEADLLKKVMVDNPERLYGFPKLI